jgi:hypothetical protein
VHQDEQNLNEDNDNEEENEEETQLWYPNTKRNHKQEVSQGGPQKRASWLWS